MDAAQPDEAPSNRIPSSHHPGPVRLCWLYPGDRRAVPAHLGSTMMRAVEELPADVDVVERFLSWAPPVRPDGVSAGPDPAE